MLHVAISDLEAAIRRDRIEKVVVGGVIFNLDPAVGTARVLLIKRAQDDYLGGLVELPSGGLLLGESLLTALAREILEETGLTLRGTPRYVGSFDYHSGSGRRSRQVNFMVSTSSANVELNPTEHCAYYWIAEAELDDFKTHMSAETRAIVQEAFALGPDV
jgi:8-oxo-dGTP diphosphatase